MIEKTMMCEFLLGHSRSPRWQHKNLSTYDNYINLSPTNWFHSILLVILTKSQLTDIYSSQHKRLLPMQCLQKSKVGPQILAV